MFNNFCSKHGTNIRQSLQRGSVGLINIYYKRAIFRMICIRSSRGRFSRRTRAREDGRDEKQYKTELKEFAGEYFHNLCANLVCKMLEVSMLQSLELINSVETPSFSTESVENKSGIVQAKFNTPFFRRVGPCEK